MSRRGVCAKLEEYYETQGKQDPVLIQVPKGGYLPTFASRQKPRAEVELRVWALVIAAGLIGCIALLWMRVGRARQQPPEQVLTRMTSDRGLSTDPGLSPDGTLLAFASDRAGSGGLDIWIQPARADAGRNEVRQLTDDPADDSQPAISADKVWVAFRSERQPPGIYLVNADGGAARLLVRDGRNPRFSPDGRSIAYWIGSPGGDRCRRPGTWP